MGMEERTASVNGKIIVDGKMVFGNNVVADRRMNHLIGEK